MASYTLKTEVIGFKDFNILLNYKRMKNVRYRISPGQHNLIEMSVPFTISEVELNALLHKLYPNFIKHAENSRLKEANTIYRPKAEDYNIWRNQIEIMIPLIEQEMNIGGIQYSYRYMKTRWGSCTPSKRKISLNTALATLSNECTHYVLVHELSHIIYPNHSPEFWHLVERYFPDYRRVRKKMKNIYLG